MDPGDLVERLFPGRYEAVGILHSGRSGMVLAARDCVLGRPVAIKVLGAGSDPDGSEPAPTFAVERFRREARVLAALDHPGIVRVHDVSSGDRPAFVMERVVGVPLARRMKDGSLAIPEVLDLARQIAEALAHAHDRGVVHRNLEPTNVLLTPEGRVRLLDFGFASLLAGPGVLATLGGPVLAEVAYAAPEVLAGAPATPASDLHSLGALVFAMAAGRAPRRPVEVAAGRFHPPPDLGAARPETPEGLRVLVTRLLSADPGARPGSVAEVARQLAGLAAPRADAGSESLLGRARAIRDAARDRVHPLKNRLAVVRRHPGRPAKVAELFARPEIRGETVELVRRTREGLLGLPGGRSANDPLSGAVRDLDPALAALAAALGRPDPLPAEELATALEAGFEACRLLLDALRIALDPHTLDLGAWLAGLPGRFDPELVATSAGGPAPGADTRHLVADAPRLLDALDEAVSTLIANAAEAGAGRVMVRLDRTGGTLRLLVEDDGPGLPPGDPERLFRGGFTTKETGTGRGLADARDRLREVGAELAVAGPSCAGNGAGQGGAAFEIRLGPRGNRGGDGQEGHA